MRPNRLEYVIAIITLAAVVLWALGCAAQIKPDFRASGGEQRITLPPSSQPSSQPAVTTIAPVSGQGNLSAPITIQQPEIAGIHYESVLPLGVAVSTGITNLELVVTLLLIAYWSHRREMTRLKHRHERYCRDPIIDLKHH